MCTNLHDSIFAYWSAKKLFMGNLATNWHKKNKVLVIIFSILISLTLFLGLLLSYRAMEKFTLERFTSQTASVLAQSIAPYNRLVNHNLPQVAIYQGFLESTSVHGFATHTFRTDAFVRSMTFYDIDISNKIDSNRAAAVNLVTHVNNIFLFKSGGLDSADQLCHYASKAPFEGEIRAAFRQAIVKLTSYRENIDSNKLHAPEEIFKFFYTIEKNKISYLSIPKQEAVKTYKQFLRQSATVKDYMTTIYTHDMVSFGLNPAFFVIKNTSPELFESIQVKPFAFDSLAKSPDFYTTKILFKLQDDCINNFSHEFKTPVTVIKLAADNIRDSDQLSARQRQQMGDILHEETNKLADLLTKLLAITQLENKTMALTCEMLNLAEFCAKVIASYQLKHPDFEINYQLKDVPYMITDHTLLGSVFTNLIDNVYKYLRLGCKKLHIEITNKNKHIQILFRDQDTSMAAHVLKNIFRKFYRIDNEFNMNGSVGIGLAFCRDIVHCIKGDIAVKAGQVKVLSL